MRSLGTAGRNLARRRAMEGSAEAARCKQAVPWHQSRGKGISRWQSEGPAAERRGSSPECGGFPWPRLNLQHSCGHGREEGSCLHVSCCLGSASFRICKVFPLGKISLSKSFQQADVHVPSPLLLLHGTSQGPQK